MKNQIHLFAIVFSFLCINLYSQTKEFKYGKIEESDLKAAICPIDSSADAYIIGDYGYSTFEYVDSKDNFQTIFERHIRIKILKKTAFDWATFIIPLYRSISPKNEERVDVKGITYNLEEGKVVTSKLEKSAIFKEEVSKSRINERITLPNVKEGSIVEVVYKIYSDFWIVRDWNFQHSIPVLISQYHLEIPEYFNYKAFQNGYEHLERTTNSQRGSFNITWYETDAGGMRIPNSRHMENISFTMNVTNYLGQNIRAFHEEPLMSSKVNYESSVEYELQSTQFPHSMLKLHSADWASITKELMDYDDFGDIIKKQGATNDIVEQATKGLTLPMDKARAIYSYIRDQFKWNGHNSLYATQAIRKIVEAKAGNSADINLLLVNALKNAGLKADPVALSTRDNGIILMSYPVLQKLNYVIASVEIDGKRILLDATNKYSPFGFLPEQCLNGQGRIISYDSPGNIDLTSNAKYSRTVNINVKVNDNGDLTGTWGEVRKGYAAHKLRNDISNAKSQDDFVQEKQKALAGLVISKYQFADLDSLHKDVGINYEVTVSNQVESTGNLLMIHPLLFEQMQENKFKLEDRKFPVDYSYLMSQTFIAQYEIPAGFQIETLPKPAALALPDKNGVFTYNVLVVGNRVQVLRKLLINKVVFLPEEYQGLKEFYNQMVAKEAEMIVLKKI